MNTYESKGMLDIEQIARYHTNIYRAALSVSPAERRLRVILAAYNHCRDDPDAKIPALLLGALESARA